MHRSLSAAVTAVAFLSFATAASAAPNLVQNGSFESYDSTIFKSFVENGSTPSVSTVVNQTNQTSGGTSYYVGQGIAGWTSSAAGYNIYWIGSEALGRAIDAHSPYPGESQKLSANFTSLSPDGGNFVMLDGDPAFRGPLSQTISGLSVGENYQVQFYWGATQMDNRVGTTTERLDVTFGSQTYSTKTVTNPTQGWQGWFQETVGFTATSTSQVLSFLSVGTPSGLPPVALLDGVSVTKVPEPASLSIVGLGLVGAGLLRRRRRVVA